MVQPKNLGKNINDNNRKEKYSVKRGGVRYGMIPLKYAVNFTSKESNSISYKPEILGIIIDRVSKNTAITKESNAAENLNNVFNEMVSLKARNLNLVNLRAVDLLKAKRKARLKGRAMGEKSDGTNTHSGLMEILVFTI